MSSRDTSASHDRQKQPAFPVDQKRAWQHAQLALKRFWASGQPEFAGWNSFQIESDPLVLHDLNGAVLFYEFAVSDGRHVAGRIKVAASKSIGAPVATVEAGPRHWDPERAKEQALISLKDMYPEAKPVATELVCYAYPKVGVLVDFEDPKRGRASIIFDASDFLPISRYGSDEKEGVTSYSFYEEIVGDDAEKRVRRWELADKELDAVLAQEKEGKLDVSKYTLKDYRDLLSPKTGLVHISLFSSKVIKFAPRCTPHDCFELRAQETNVYCAVATGQMILDFYRYYYSQTDIATAMGTDAGGTSNPGQVTGYETLSNDGLIATYDGTAAWAEAKAEIDANRPVKSGIPGHARACAGWMRQNISLVGQPPQKWLKIYDPWPWNADACVGGAVVWEDWEAVTHTNFIYVSHS